MTVPNKPSSGDGPQRVQVTLQLVDHMTAGILDVFLCDLAAQVAARQSLRENLSQRGALMERLNVLTIELTALDPLPNLRRQIRRQYPGWL
jgi:hypothetical protein